MKILVLLDRFKQVTAVANALEMKQPTISFHMKKMESEWGVKLFEAKAGRIYLTNAGKMMLPYAFQISKLYSEAESKIGEWRDNERAALRVGCTDCALTALARSGWLLHYKNQSDILISIQSGDEETLNRQLQAEMLDVILCGMPSRENDDFMEEKLKSSALKLVVPLGHPLLQSKEIAAHHLYKYAFIDHTEVSLNENIALWRAMLSWSLDVKAKFDSIELILGAVSAGMGLAILPEIVLPDPAQRVAVLDLPGQSSPWSLYASWRPNYWNPTLVRRFVDSVFQ
ncbi:LysR family transcriptional regulator [Cohnella herbarum]|uniref:LysR family transcriptional regulator n=1 Tax=Cohnella herbarum TaxID=2728023 RepID=A0A7Z2VJ01_9BACL|nr:LysR family transcriptional regulator [Cohnella herbarum]QJD83934.1 LysR family transcriptional regulator [Cohnella herbarum]